MRVCLFTDTLGDVNGVSRFIRNAGDRAAASGRGLTVLTSTRLAVPGAAHFVNVPPVAAWPMPRYEHLEVVLPRRGELLRRAVELRPDAVHVSTPGPVGLVGRAVARKLGVPLLGTYHTDFPAYVERLFEDAVMGRMTTAVMRWFYGPFDRVFARSGASMEAMGPLRLPRSRMVALTPGMDVEAFHPRFRDEAVWVRAGGSPASEGRVRVLSCGRVSVEKNLPLLARAWRMAEGLLAAAGRRAELMIVGDGPYQAEMRRELAGVGTGARVVFAGFRFGAELSALYATADLFVFPSTTDTLGQVVMEAQASGIPVLVSEVGGPRTMMAEGETGLVLPGGDAGAWARAIAGVCGDAGERARMGAAAHRRMQRYSFAASFEDFWSVHERAVAEHREARAVPS